MRHFHLEYKGQWVTTPVSGKRLGWGQGNGRVLPIAETPSLLAGSTRLTEACGSRRRPIWESAVSRCMRQQAMGHIENNGLTDAGVSGIAEVVWRLPTPGRRKLRTQILGNNFHLIKFISACVGKLVHSKRWRSYWLILLEIDLDRFSRALNRLRRCSCFHRGRCC